MTMPAPTPTDEARERAACMSRHPAGRALIRAAVATVAAAGMLAAGAGTASARPVLDDPAGPYCGPGMVAVGAQCVRTVLPDDPGPSGAVGALAPFALVWLLFA